MKGAKIRGSVWIMAAGAALGLLAGMILEGSPLFGYLLGKHPLRMPTEIDPVGKPAIGLIAAVMGFAGSLFGALIGTIKNYARGQSRNSDEEKEVVR